MRNKEKKRGILLYSARYVHAWIILRNSMECSVICHSYCISNFRFHHGLSDILLTLCIPSLSTIWVSNRTPLCLCDQTDVAHCPAHFGQMGKRNGWSSLLASITQNAQYPIRASKDVLLLSYSNYKFSNT